MNTNGHTRTLWQRLFGREEPPSPKPKEMQESWPFPDWMGAYQELFGRLTSRDGWWPIGVIAPWQRRKGFDYPFFNSEQEHALLRSQSRILCGTSNYAKGLIAGYGAYVLGDGLTYRWMPKDDAIPDLAQLVAKELQKITDAHMKRNQWHGGEQPALEDEFFRRAIRDGEPILIHFPNADGSVDERFCEPDQLRKPMATTDEEWSFGIRTHPNDVSNPLGYWVCWDSMPENGEEIPPERVIHMRRNVDRNIKRGLPDFIFHTAATIDGADKLLTALVRGATIQASIAGVRQHEAATIEQVDGFRDGDPQAFKTTNPVSGRTETNRQFYPGEVWDIPKGLNFVPPPGADNVDKHIMVLDAALRSAGRLWNAPEWLGSGDASNNNYSSSLTAESPFVLKVKKEQAVFGETLGTAIKYACQHYCEVRGLKLGNMLRCSWEEVEMLCELKVTARSPIARDPHKEAVRDKVYIGLGVKSRQMAAEEQGYEWHKVERDNEEYTAAHPQPMMGQGPPGGDGQAPPGQDGQGGRPDNQPPQGGPPAQMQESKDAAGHEHKGPGPGGGQFTGTGGGLPKLSKKQADRDQERKDTAARVALARGKDPEEAIREIEASIAAERSKSPADRWQDMLDGINSGDVTDDNYHDKVQAIVDAVPTGDLKEFLSSVRIHERPKSRSHALHLAWSIVGNQLESKHRMDTMREEVLYEGFDPTKHPRGKDGKFIPIGELVAAMHDPRKADELRQRVRPEDRAALERRINPGAYKKKLAGLAGMGGNQPSTQTMAAIKGDVAMQQAGATVAASGERARMQNAITASYGQSAPPAAQPPAQSATPLTPSGAMDLSGQPLQNRQRTKAERQRMMHLATALSYQPAGMDKPLEAELHALSQGATLEDARRAGEAVGGKKNDTEGTTASPAATEAAKAWLKHTAQANEKSAATPSKSYGTSSTPPGPSGPSFHPDIPVYIRGNEKTSSANHDLIQAHGGKWNKDLKAWVVDQDTAKKLKAAGLAGLSMSMPKDVVKKYHPERITESIAFETDFGTVFWEDVAEIAEDTKPNLTDQLRDALREFGETIGQAVRDRPINVQVNTPPMTVQNQIDVPAPQVAVNMPEQPAPVVNNTIEIPAQKATRILRDENGDMIGTEPVD